MEEPNKTINVCNDVEVEIFDYNFTLQKLFDHLAAGFASLQIFMQDEYGVDISNSEVEVSIVDLGYHGDHEYVIRLNARKEIPNPNYSIQMRQYLNFLEKEQKEKEAQKKEERSYALSSKARKEYKEQRKQERIKEHIQSIIDDTKLNKVEKLAAIDAYIGLDKDER